MDITDMRNQSEIAQQQGLLATYRRRLAYHLEQRAIYGAAAPFSLAADIRQGRDNIQRIKAVLRSWGVVVEGFPDDEPREPPDSLISSTLEQLAALPLDK